jgi:hypothetical protein
MTKRILLLAAVFSLGAIAQSNVYAQAAATPAPPAAGEAASPAAGAEKGTKTHKHHKGTTHHRHHAAKKESPSASPAASPSPAAQ